MRVVTEPSESRGPSVVAVGVFDGLHRGHQAVIARVRELARARDVLATVATFDPHPAEVLDPAHAPVRLGTLEQRLEGLRALGVDQVRVLAFDEALAAQSAEEFVEGVLVAELGARAVVVGRDFRFGHGRRGDVALLARLGHLGYEMEPADLVGEGERFSSSSVRAHLIGGDVEAAAAMLGRPFVVRAAVARGDGRGRELGYPTANLELATRQAIPADGVYAGAARVVGGAWVAAAVSVGTRPQFYERADRLVEVHLLEEPGDLYSARLDVAFLARLRPQEVFADVAALVAQIGSDVERSRALYGEFHPEASVLLG